MTNRILDHRAVSSSQAECQLEIRVSNRELRSVLVVDDDTALVPGPADGHMAAVVRDSDALRALELVFAAVWAGMLADQFQPGPRLSTDLGKSILYQLCSGRTDEAAARSLQIPLRTYGRYVADIMRELGANSRFQAGVRAFELGLLGADQAGPGSVPVRLLTLPHLLVAEDLVRITQVSGDYPVEIRFARVPPVQALIIDSRVFVPETGCAGDPYATLIRIAEVVRAISTFFQSVWADAAPENKDAIFADRQRTVLVRRILGALHGGVPDKVAARQLNVSERTYGRYVAEAMAAIGASSRCHAGVRAAELGLLGSPQEGILLATAEPWTALTRPALGRARGAEPSAREPSGRGPA